MEYYWPIKSNKLDAHNLHESQKHAVEFFFLKQEFKGCLVYDSIYVTFLRDKTVMMEIKSIIACGQGLGQEYDYKAKDYWG